MASLTMLLVTAFYTGPDAESPPLAIEDVLISTMEQVEVPAREPGVVSVMETEEGNLVKAGEALGQIDDSDARLAKQRAEIDLETARAEAKNDIKLRLAQKALKVAESELDRGVKSAKLFDRAVTEEELERRRLAVEKAKLDVEQAKHDQMLAELKARLARNELEYAERGVERRRFVAPIDGMVVQLNRRAGEWAEPGQTVMRILRLNRLRAEGYVAAEQLSGELVGSPVKVTAQIRGQGTVEFDGHLRFISPEINPVDNRVRIWAEIENRDLMLRPGMQAAMLVIPRPAAPASSDE